MASRTFPESCRCFWIGCGVTLCLALVWPLAALIWAGPRQDAWRWIVGSTSWGFFPVFILPIVVGTFLALMPLSFFLPRRFGGERGAASYSALIVLVAVAAIFAVCDGYQGGLFPVYLQNAKERAQAYKYAYALRAKIIEKSGVERDNYLRGLTNDTEALKYMAILGLTKAQHQASFIAIVEKSPKNVWENGNIVGRISIVWNFLVAVFFAFCLWMVGLIAARARYLPDEFRKDHLIVAMALLSLFFPARLFGTWYAHHFIPCENRANSDMLLVLFVIFAIATVFLGFIWFGKLKYGTRAIAIGVPFINCAVMAAKAYKLAWLPSIFEGITGTQPIYILLVCVAFLFLEGVAVCNLLNDRCPERQPCITCPGM